MKNKSYILNFMFINVHPMLYTRKVHNRALIVVCNMNSNSKVECGPDVDWDDRSRVVEDF